MPVHVSLRSRVNAMNVVRQNRLLALLAPAERERVTGRCDRVHLEQRTVVYERGAEIDEVYFPLSGIVSLVITSEQGETVEVGTVGNEGMVGSPLALGADSSPFEAMVQVAGEFLRLPREELRRELKRDGGLRSVAERFAQALTNQIAQSVLCNRAHSVEERLCRWFLMAHDRVGSSEISLTQEFVAQMLGVRRPSVTVAAGILQKAGLITYAPGKLKIVDRAGLEACACECYRIIRDETDRLLKA